MLEICAILQNVRLLVSIDQQHLVPVPVAGYLTMTRVDPRVSVVMPTYTGSAFFIESIKKLVAQTMPDFELVLTDDRSTDETFEIVRRYAVWDARIIPIARADSGIALLPSLMPANLAALRS